MFPILYRTTTQSSDLIFAKQINTNYLYLIYIDYTKENYAFSRCRDFKDELLEPTSQNHCRAFGSIRLNIGFSTQNIRNLQSKQR